MIYQLYIISAKISIYVNVSKKFYNYYNYYRDFLCSIDDRKERGIMLYLLCDMTHLNIYRICYAYLELKKRIFTTVKVQAFFVYVFSAKMCCVAAIQACIFTVRGLNCRAFLVCADPGAPWKGNII